jgi:hypothetical protein
MFEAMLLAPLFAPMLARMGSLGEYELDLLAEEVARCDRTGFAALIAARLERAP